MGGVHKMEQEKIIKKQLNCKSFVVLTASQVFVHFLLISFVITAYTFTSL